MSSCSSTQVYVRSMNGNSGVAVIGRMKELVYNGVRYKSARQFSLDTGVGLGSVYGGIKAGLSADEIVERYSPRVTEIEYNGVKYPSVGALAREFGISKSTLWGRLQAGQTLEEALSAPVTASSRYIEYNGKKYKSLKQCAEGNNISYVALKSRLDRGWGLEKAICTPLRSELAQKVEYKGGFYTVGELCKELGISDRVRLVAGRIRNGWPVERAIEESAGLLNQVEYDGVVYKDLVALCSEFGVSYPAVRTRMSRMGMSLEEALNYEGAKVSYGGVVCKSRKELCNRLGLNYSTVSSIMKRNCVSLSEAIASLGISESSAVFRSTVARLPDAADARFVCDDKFVMVTCRVCNKVVMLSIDEAVDFRHSENCVKNEWRV